MELDSGPHWFILNHITTGLSHRKADKVIAHFNESNETKLELFAPTHIVREVRGGKIRMRSAKLMFHYVFVRGTFTQVKALCRENNGFSFLLNRSGAKRYALIGETEMQQLRRIARVYENALPFFSIEDIDLEAGDLVEVVNGDFPGLTGTFLPKARSNAGNIVLKVCENIGTIAYDIKVSDVRVLEFSAHSTRANDQIDAYVPHLLKALRLHYADELLPAPLVTKLIIFARRMEVVNIPNQKLESKLQALLYSTNIVLGNLEAAAKNMERYEKIKHSVTNIHTQILISLVIGVADKSKDGILEAINLNTETEMKSAAQRKLAEELDFYSSGLN